MRLVIVLISIALVLMSINIGICESESESGRNDEHKSTTLSPSTTTPEPSGEDEDGEEAISVGESRADGGFIVKQTPRYLGHIFGMKAEPILSNEHGRHGGFSLHLDDKHALIHHASLDKWGGGDSHSLHENGHLMVPAREKINPYYQGDHSAPKGWVVPDNGANLSGSAFNLVRFHEKRPIQARPKLETNKNEFGTNCNLYAYGRGGKVSGSRSSDEEVPGLDKPATNTRPWLSDNVHSKMLRFPVERFGDKCDNGLCQMAVNQKKLGGDSVVCDHIREAGAPVLCGQEQKVTYLLKPTHIGGTCDEQNFNAFHVPHLIGDLQKHNVPVNQ